ncbi:hypothetical protein [Hoeflea sp. TYP-13]|uniref:hypothetical protein n=1 Tax=Hoeflea sp. TYP-13 TaxID=3230023 RepID=UPI0034C6C665
MPNRVIKYLVVAAAAAAPALATVPAMADNGLPTHIKGLGTYSGGISAKRFKGNGIYFYVDNGREYYPQPLPEKPPLPRNGAKIIDVGDAQPAMDCDQATKICVIRP